MDIKLEHINAFIAATVETFEAMCNLKFRRQGELRKVNGEILDCNEVLALVGLSGDVRGAVMVNAPLHVAMRIVSGFLGEEVTCVNCDLMDAMGEIVNILAGAADAKIEGLRVELALPTVLAGKRTQFFAKAGHPFIVVPLEIPDVGPFYLGVSIVPKD